jgi:hypothetical protein
MALLLAEPRMSSMPERAKRCSSPGLTAANHDQRVLDKRLYGHQCDR